MFLSKYDHTERDKNVVTSSLEYKFFHFQTYWLYTVSF